MSRVTRKRFVLVAPDGAVRLVKVADAGRGKKTRIDLGVSMSADEYSAICTGPLSRIFEDCIDDDWRLDGKRFRALVDDFIGRAARRRLQEERAVKAPAPEDLAAVPRDPVLKRVAILDDRREAQSTLHPGKFVLAPVDVPPASPATSMARGGISPSSRPSSPPSSARP